MKIILANGTELTPILVTGAKRTVQGVSRDTLSFVFPGGAGMEALDAAFTGAACEAITVTGEDGSEYIHTGYTIRAELKKTAVEVLAATADTGAVYEDRITVSMSQRTWAETQLAALTDTVDVLVMESLMAE